MRGPLTLGAVFEPHPDASRFDSSHVGVSDVQRRDGFWWMWYFGGSQAEMQFGPQKLKGVDLRPGLALSGDGLNWLRVEGPHRGALLDVGKPGEFDMVFCGWPQVVADAIGHALPQSKFTGLIINLIHNEFVLIERVHHCVLKLTQLT